MAYQSLIETPNAKRQRSFALVRPWASSTGCARHAIRRPTAWSNASMAASVNSSARPASSPPRNWRRRSNLTCRRITTAFLSVRSITSHPFRRSNNGRPSGLNCSTSGFMNSRDSTIRQHSAWDECAELAINVLQFQNAGQHLQQLHIIHCTDLQGHPHEFQ